jgi:polar amino acid transport system substrate-binding protein
MNKKSAGLIFLSAIILLLIGCAKNQPHGLTLQEGVLSVGVEIGYPPMEYYDADGVTLTGFDIELTKALAEKLNLQVKFIDTAWEGILAGLDSNRYDMAINVTILPERQKRYNFTKPYIDSSIAIVILKGSSLKIESPKDIAGLRVSYQGDTTAQYFTEKLSAQGIRFSFFSYDKIINCFDDLKLRRVDLVVVDSIAASFYSGGENSPFETTWAGPSDEFIGICLKKGNDALTAALDNALDELFADGTLVEISQRIFNRDLVSSVRYIPTF